MRVLTGSNDGDIVDIKRPVIAAAANVNFEHRIDSHRHSRGQLLYSEQGCLVVSVENKSCYITPDQAMWIPPGLDHYIEAKSAVSYRSAYVDGNACSPLPKSPAPVVMTALKKELINTASEFRADYSKNTAEFRLVSVLHDQMLAMQPSNMSLPMPKDKRLVRLIAELMDNPADTRTRQEWGDRVGASDRTLGRLFLRETGYSFNQWRQRFLINQAIQLLHDGQTVTTTAFHFGYHSASAFSAMFKRVTGESPKQYLDYRC